jgi:signal transduction histidine kinase
VKIRFEHYLPKLPLGTRAALAAVSALILVSIIFTTLFFTFHKQSLINELRIRSLSLASNLAYNSAYPVIANDLESLYKLINGIIREKDIEKAMITDKKGNILASTDSVYSAGKLLFEIPFTLKNQAWLPTNSRNFFRAITPIIFEKREKLGDESDLLSPLRKSLPQEPQITEKSRREIVGFVILEVSLVNLNKLLSQNLLKVLIVTTLIIAIGGIITVLVVQKIVRPLRVLAQATKEIAKGEFGKTIPITRTDEIGILANFFNEMTLQLKKSRDDYEALNRELEIKVAESTKELNAKYLELEQTLGSLKQKDFEKDDYLAFISHEIRNPLSSIQLYSEMMLRGFAPFEKKREDFLNNIINNCQRLSRLLTDVLDCLKLEAGKMNFRLANFELGDLLNEVITSLEPNLRAKNLRFHHRFLENKIDVYSDRDKLFQVLTNIISNAIKFSYEGGEIVVSLEDLDDSFEIRVKDYGIGIKKEDIPKLFDKFTQLGQMSYDLEGSGLGLTISKSIIEQLGGAIVVDSTLGEGTTASITLSKKVKAVT